MTKSNILVVGGAGYIGSHVNKELHKAGYSTIVYDNLSTGNRDSVIVGEFIEGDIGDRQSLKKLFSQYQIDAVMHFAAYIDVKESVLNPSKYYRNNFTNTQTLIDTMLEHDINKFLFSSTAAIFGIPIQDIINEDHPKNPINPYGHSKLMVEQLLQDYDAAYNLKYCALRYFNVAGGDPDRELKNLKFAETNLIPVILRNLKNSNRQSTIFGSDYPTKDGTCVRDYIHIIDLSDAHLKGLQKLLTGGESDVYNLGNGIGYTVREVIEAVCKATGQKLNIVEGPRRAGDPHALIADGTKAERQLNWHPKYTLEEMIEHAWVALDGNAIPNVFKNYEL